MGLVAGPPAPGGEGAGAIGASAPGGATNGAPGRAPAEGGLTLAGDAAPFVPGTASTFSASRPICRNRFVRLMACSRLPSSIAMWISNSTPCPAKRTEIVPVPRRPGAAALDATIPSSSAAVKLMSMDVLKLLRNFFLNTLTCNQKSISTLTRISTPMAAYNAELLTGSSNATTPMYRAP